MIFRKKSEKYGLEAEILVDDCDAHLLSNYGWGLWKTERHSGFYVVFQNSPRNKDLRNKRLHRIIMQAKSSDIVDHINRNPLDNRRSNLRLCTQAENNRNAGKRKDGRDSQFKGVSKSKFIQKPWIYQIQKDFKKYGGYAKTELEAAEAYNNLARELFGVYAVLNIIPQDSK